MPHEDTQTIARPTRQPTSVACAHCGLPSPLPEAAELPFCCEGCRGAYHLIRDWDLGEYYALRDQLGGARGEAVRVPSRLEQFDDPMTLGDSVPLDCGGGMVRSRLAVQGLHCGACAWLIERAAAKQPGWHSARVRLSDHTLEAVYDPQTMKLSEVATLVSRLGYQVAPLVESKRQLREAAENRQHLVRIAIAGFCAMNSMWLAVALYAGTFSGIAPEHRWLLHWAGVILGMISVAFPGRVFFRGAWAALRTRTPHMDLPVALGLSVGAIAGLVAAITERGEAYFDSVAMLVFLLLVGRWIQFRQQRRATESVALLMRLTPRVASKVNDDSSVTRVPADSLLVNDIVRVEAGDTFPTDGIIESGDTQVDRSLVTGESRPVSATCGDHVEAGSCNLQYTVDVRVEAVGRESRVGKITSLIEEAAAQRAPIVQLADSIGAWFVVSVLLMAFGTLVYWWHVDPFTAAGNAIALLIVACPCALALATPLAIAVAIGRCAKRGILIRGADSLERVNRVGTVWFDKTGTLTVGQLRITRWDSNDDQGDDATLAMAAAIEAGSKHLVAAAILDAAKRRLLTIPTATDVCQVPGLGVHGTVLDHTVHLGNQSFMDSLGISLSSANLVTVREISSIGSSPLIMAVDFTIVAIAAVDDEIRSDASKVVRSLQQAGWQVGVLSGDHKETVKRVAAQLGIAPDLTFGGVAPEDKLAQIRASRCDGQTVLMVGDGVNDAAALAAADVGIAIRGGAAVSLDAAPVYLSSGKLTSLLDLVDACSRTVTTIRWNFAISLGYNVFAVALAACGWISPLVAAVLMPASSLSVLSLVLISRTFAHSNTSSSNTSFAEPNVRIA